MEKWAKIGKDKVVLHQFSRGGVAPSPSPFPLKLETYLRMANIPYEVFSFFQFRFIQNIVYSFCVQCDFEEPFGPKGKTPWITINGQEIADSQLCLEFLAETFQKDFSSHLSPLEQATARAYQIMCEEHLFWQVLFKQYFCNFVLMCHNFRPLVLWRFVYTNGESVPHVMPAMPRFMIPLAAKL